MTIFEKTPYFDAINKETNFSHDEIFNTAQDQLKFQHWEVSYKKFGKEYLAEGWRGRKVVALPLAIWAGVIKTVYHLAKLIIGLLDVLARKGEYQPIEPYLKKQVFYIVRDFHESVGWIISIFNDKYGQYHIQESRFHKSCYDCFADNFFYDLGMRAKNYFQRHNKNYSQRYNKDFSQQVLEELSAPLNTRSWKQQQIYEESLSYYDQGMFDEAFKTICKDDRDSQEKFLLIENIAKVYFNQGQLDKAEKTIEKLPNSPTKSEFLIRVAQSYFAENMEKNAQKIIKTLIVSEFIGEFKKTNQLNIYQRIMNENTNQYVEFVNQLENECYEKIKPYFQVSNSDSILQTIIDIITDPLKIQTFMGLENIKV